MKAILIQTRIGFYGYKDFQQNESNNVRRNGKEEILLGIRTVSCFTFFEASNATSSVSNF